MDNFDLRKYLAENKLLKEEIDFPELEDEFEGAMDAMIVEPEVYLQDIIDASAEEIVSDDYYEIMNAVEQGVYSAEEAVKLAKAWAKDKLSSLAENKLIKEYLDLEIDEDEVIINSFSGEYTGFIEDDGTVDFSVVYEDEDDRDGMEFDEDNWKDILGPKHAFVKISNQIPTKVEAVDDYVMITVDVEDLKGIANLSENRDL